MTKKVEAAGKVTYEGALTKLEDAVRHLEKGDLTLEDSLKAFEDGIKWSRLCEEKLSEAKGKVETLIRRAGGDVGVKDFEVGE